MTCRFVSVVYYKDGRKKNYECYICRSNNRFATIMNIHELRNNI